MHYGSYVRGVSRNMYNGIHDAIVLKIHYAGEKTSAKASPSSGWFVLRMVGAEANGCPTVGRPPLLHSAHVYLVSIRE